MKNATLTYCGYLLKLKESIYTLEEEKDVVSIEILCFDIKNP